MNKITDKIWIGDSHDAKGLEALKAAGITAVLNCAHDLDPQVKWADGMLVYHCGLVDGEGNQADLYAAAILILHSIVRADQQVLVHCHEGRSRSVFIVACWMVRHMGLLIEEAIEYIRQKGRDVKVNPAHIETFQP